MDIYLIIGILILIIFLLILTIIMFRNKIVVLNYKTEESEKVISESLLEKQKHIVKLKKILDKSEVKVIPDEFLNINYNELTIYELDEELKKYDLVLFETFEYNVNINFTEKGIKAFRRFKRNNIEMIGIKRYFNDNVELLNKSLKKFPAKIIAKLMKIKPKKKFSIIKEEILEI